MMEITLKIVLSLLVAVHGLIHLMGFAKAFKFAEMPQLTQPISRFQGVFWLIAALFFLALIPAVWIRKEWWIFAIIAPVISQTLIFFSWQDAKFGTIANIIIFIIAVVIYAQFKSA